MRVIPWYLPRGVITQILPCSCTLVVFHRISKLNSAPIYTRYTFMEVRAEFGAQKPEMELIKTPCSPSPCQHRISPYNKLSRAVSSLVLSGPSERASIISLTQFHSLTNLLRGRFFF